MSAYWIVRYKRKPGTSKRKFGFMVQVNPNEWFELICASKLLAEKYEALFRKDPLVAEVEVIQKVRGT